MIINLENSRKVIIDTSALLVLLNKEEGWEAVMHIIPKAIISSVNVTEVTEYLLQKKKMPLEEVMQLIDLFTTEVVDYNSSQSYTAAKLLIEHDLSLGDRACIALSISTRYPIVTANKIWKDLQIDDVTIHVIG